MTKRFDKISKTENLFDREKLPELSQHLHHWSFHLFWLSFVQTFVSSYFILHLMISIVTHFVYSNALVGRVCIYKKFIDPPKTKKEKKSKTNFTNSVSTQWAWMKRKESEREREKSQKDRRQCWKWWCCSFYFVHSFNIFSRLPRFNALRFSSTQSIEPKKYKHFVFGLTKNTQHCFNVSTGSCFIWTSLVSVVAVVGRCILQKYFQIYGCRRTLAFHRSHFTSFCLCRCLCLLLAQISVARAIDRVFCLILQTTATRFFNRKLNFLFNWTELKREE